MADNTSSGNGLSPVTIAKLKSVSTATLTTQLFKRGFRNLFIQSCYRQTVGGPRLVGPAYTLRYIPAREDLDQLSAFEDWEHPQRKAVEEIPEGHVLVMDTRGDARAASAGNILVTRLMKRGAGGVVTDGGLRDLPDIRELNWPVYAQKASAPTNLIHHHAVDINVPIACGDVPVFPDDVLVGDDEGVVVIPRHLVDEVAEDAAGQEKFEQFVIDEVSKGQSIFGLYPPNEKTLKRYQQVKASYESPGGDSSG